MINERPDAGLREVARATGLSPATVRDVRQRLNRSEDPVPRRYRAVAHQYEDSSAGTVLPHKPPNRPRLVAVPHDPHRLLAKLRNDPSLRFNEAGRRTLRWLHQHILHIESWKTHENSVPDHCAPVVADLARSCATAWMMLAEQLERRVNSGAGRVSRKTK